MLKPFAGFAPAPANTAAPMEQIPAGAYVARILTAEEVNGFLV